jgi:hypothetical protein
MTPATPAALTNQEILVLIRTCVEMLGIPLNLCSRRICRRANACLFVAPETGEPECTSLSYDKEMVALVAQLFCVTADIAEGKYPAAPSIDPERRELEEAACDIIRASRKSCPALSPGFERWVAAYRRQGEVAQGEKPDLPSATLASRELPQESPTQLLEEPEIWQMIERVKQPEPRVRIDL